MFIEVDNDKGGGASAKAIARELVEGELSLSGFSNHCGAYTAKRVGKLHVELSTQQDVWPTAGRL
jgi:hypothetical protein